MAGVIQEERFVEPPNLESSFSGVAWGAVFAGGATATGVTLILLLLGSGLGLAAVSPWAGASMTATGLAVGAAIWLVVVQWIASAIGGYTAGRLRTKWAAHYSDEVFFRDTAHGLLAWAVGTFIMVWVFASAGLTAAFGIASGVQSVATVAAETQDEGSSLGDTYFVDQLFRRDVAPAASAEPNAAPAAESTAAPAAEGADAGAATNAGTASAATAATAEPAGAQRSPTASGRTREDLDGASREAAPIFGRAVLGTGTDADRAYLAEIVSERTGMSQADAEARVDQVVAEAKEAADTARKAGATASIITALSLLLGAFIAAVAGALGGHYRDALSDVK
jgi:hypothetical protein